MSESTALVLYVLDGIGTRPIVTRVAVLQSFHEAEGYHQDYLANHPNEPYIVINDLPKIENLRKQFPELYVKKPPIAEAFLESALDAGLSAHHAGTRVALKTSA